MKIDRTTHYYPFGLEFGDYLGTSLSISPNYKYSTHGKEKQQETGWSDFGGRMYMSDTGRWFSPDPLSEEFGDWSPYNYVFNNPVRYADPDGNAPIDVVGEGDGCCQHMKGFALTMVDNVIGSNLRNKYGSKTQEYRDGVNNGHGASMVLAALIATDGVTSIGGGTGGLALSSAASSTGVGAVAGGPGAAVSGGLILKGTLEVAGAAVITKNVVDNMKSDNGSNKKAPSLNSQRQGAVRKAWKDEQNMVKNGKDGTREWTKAELKELKETGKVKGMKGHHINNVKHHPEQAGDPNNIEFVTQKEHLDRHNGNFRNKTTGKLKNRQ